MTEQPAEVSFRVFGTPGAQGSKKGFAIKKGGQFTGSVALSENSKKVAPWRADVKAAAEEAIAEASSAEWEPWEVPCAVEAVFHFKRPNSHYGTGRNADKLKDWAPYYVTGHSKGDIDKLLRSTFDAITASGLWKDDAYAVRVQSTKIYSPREGASITVRPIRGPVQPPEELE